jgi:hypothetical protein
MALLGVHIVCGFTGVHGGAHGQVALLGRTVWSQTMLSAGTTTQASPYESNIEGEPVFSLYSSGDIYYAIGTNPDATSGTRRFLAANTPADVFGDRAGGEKVAWIFA